MSNKEKQYVDIAGVDLTKIRDKTKNHYTGESVEDLMPEAVPDTVEGATPKDTDYEDGMYSEEQMARHEQLEENIYTVNGVPSRWEHNKLRSKWHFDPFRDPLSEQTYIVPVRFTNDFTDVVESAIANNIPMTQGNYRHRDKSRQDQDLHDAEMMDLKRGTRDGNDLQCMGKVPIYINSEKRQKINTEPVYDVLHRMMAYLDMEVQQARLHVQYLGEVTSVHIDQQMRNARPWHREQWLRNGGDKNPLVLRRFLIQLQDWEIGHVWQFGNTYLQGYKSGSAVTYDWVNMPHGTANFGYTPRVTFQVTGFVSAHTQALIDAQLAGEPVPEIEV